jgi:hypothetical protein
MFLTQLPTENAIRVGNWLHKPSAVNQLLARSVKLVVHEVTADQGYLSHTGSCTLLAYRGRPFIVATRHQLGIPAGVKPDTEYFDMLRFSRTSGDHLGNIPVDACAFETTNCEEVYHDLLFFKVHASWNELSAERPYFFPINTFTDGDRRISYFYGHPSSRNVISYDPSLHAHVATALIDGYLDRDFTSQAEYYRRYRYERSDYEVDGFSGGAAFSLIESPIGWQIVLDGIIVRAGNGYLHIVDSTFLCRAFSKIE